MIQQNKGVDFWWSSDYDQELLKTLPRNPNGAYSKSSDIFDIWFDSGSTFNSVIKSPQADLYCEGIDQFTGWFQSSLLLGVALNNQSPYKNLLVHGFVVDENDRKMSKSVGNVIEPVQAIEGGKNKLPQSGLDTLRFWVAHEYYKPNIQIGPAILEKFIKRVFEIRSIVRFVIGNLNDLKSLDKDLLRYEQLLPVDKFILSKLNSLSENVIENYNSMNLNKSVNSIESFMLTQLSSFYVKTIKDRLYCDRSDSVERRSAQTALYHVLAKLLPMIAPVMPHLAEEAFLNSILKQNKPDASLFRSELGLSIESAWQNKQIESLFGVVNSLRDRFYEKIQTNNAATFDVTIKCDQKLFGLLNEYTKQTGSNAWLVECFGSASLKLELTESKELTELYFNGEKLFYEVNVEKCRDKHACPRCRRFTSHNESHLCTRCSLIVNQ